MTIIAIHRVAGWTNSVVCAVLLLVGSQSLGAQELTWAEKMFDKRSHDFGFVARGADIRYRFKVTNIYKEDVHIAEVRTTCGCSAAKPTVNTLKTRDVAYIDVIMNTRRFTRRKDSSLVVTFDQPFYSEVTIPIKAYIRTDVVLTPGEVNFGPVEFGKGAQRKLEIAYAGRDDWTIRGVRVNHKRLSAKVIETKRGNGLVNYDLLVTLKPDAPIGKLNHQIFLMTDDANSPYVPVLVRSRVEADITITPSLVSLGLLRPGQTKTVNIVIRGKKSISIEKIECDSDKEAFKARLPKQARRVHVIPLTFTVPDTPGTFTERFTVSIVGRDVPLAFKASGNIVRTESP